MSITRDGVFDASVAETYDRDHGETSPELIEATVALLSELSVNGAALEFAIGTGRIALPLAKSGVPVQGVELSQAMVDKLREKPGGEDLKVVVGDMTKTSVDGQFSLVFLVFNTICNLVTQGQQIDCFKNAAAHLAPGGRFVIEVGLPPLQSLPFGETKLAFARSREHWGMDEFEVATQSFVSHHIWMNDEHVRQLSVPFRYVWPSELDLMARLAGLELEHRWENWCKAPFTNLSQGHVSVWRNSAR